MAEASGLIAILVLTLARSAFAGDNFVAKLSGDEKVPARGTKAVGVAKFKLRDDGAALKFKVNVAKIERRRPTPASAARPRARSA